MPNGLAGSAQVSYPLWAPDGTAAAPSYSFAAAHGTGHYRVGGALMSSVAGSWIGGFSLDLGSLMLSSTLSLGWSSGHQTTPDLTLYRDAANVLAQKNGTAAQQFRIYGTTAGSQYLSLLHAGDGTYGGITTSTALNLYLGVNQFSQSWGIGGPNGTLFPSADNTLDIGTGVLRPRTIYAGTSVVVPVGSNVAPGLVFNAPTNTPQGLSIVSTRSLAFSTDGFYRFVTGYGGTEIGSADSFGWSNGTNNVGGGTPDVLLWRDAAGVLALRNSTNAQTFRVYNTYTDASNYERAMVMWDTNTLKIGMEYAGTGSNRSVHLISGGSLSIFTNSTLRWYFDSSGHFLANTDNTYDIGASGATRPRTIYVGTSFVSGTAAAMYADANAIVFNDNAGTTSLAVRSDFHIIPAGSAMAWGNTVSQSYDTGFYRLAAASIRQGLTPSATPVAQTFTIGEASRPGTDTNVAGGSATIRTGLGTGTGTPAVLYIQTASPVGSGSVAQNYVTIAYFTCNAGGSGGFAMGNGYGIGWDGLTSVVSNTIRIPSAGYLEFGNYRDIVLNRLAANSLQLGSDASATPAAYTFTVGEFARGGTDNNVAGADGTIRSGSGTGNAAGSSLFFDTPTVGASGSVQQSYGHRLTLSALGATFDIPDQGLRINNQVNGAGASAGTLTNAPSAGNPNFWLPISIAGTTRYFPGW